MTTPSPSEPHLELDEAYARHRACQQAGDWDGLADSFGADATYFDSIHGSFDGREAIRRFLVRMMRNSGTWEFEELWRVTAGDRVVFGWTQRFSESRPDGTAYEFSGITMLRLGRDGRWYEQADLYDAARARTVLHEWAVSRKNATSENTS